MDWFRMYGEFATDAKVQSMPEAMQRRLVMLLCLRCSNTIETLLEDEMADALRIDQAALAETKALFIRKRFIDDAWNLLQWDKRQFQSDSSTKRVAEHRERKRRAAEAAQMQADVPEKATGVGIETACNVSVTRQIQIQIQKQNKDVNTLGASAPSAVGEFALSSPPPSVVLPAKHADTDPEFERAWAMYPARHGGNPKKAALAAWKARRAAGVDAAVMIAGLERYRVHITNSGKLGTQFVLQGATFFGPGERYLEPWPAGKSTAARHLSVAGQDYGATQQAMSQSLARLPLAAVAEIPFD